MNPFVSCKMAIKHFSRKGLRKALRAKKMFYNMGLMINFVSNYHVKLFVYNSLNGQTTHFA